MRTPLLTLGCCTQFTVLLFAEIRCGEGAEGEVEEQEEEEHRIGFLWEDKSYNQACSHFRVECFGACCKC